MMPRWFKRWFNDDPEMVDACFGVAGLILGTILGCIVARYLGIICGFLLIGVFAFSIPAILVYRSVKR
jgi:hypothetical protein